MDIRPKMRMPRYRVVLLTVFFASLLFFLFQMGILPGTLQRSAPAKGFQLLEDLFYHIRNDYLEERDPAQTAEGAYRGLVNSLDPVSCYLSKELAARFTAGVPADVGPGITVFKKYGGFPQVVGVVPGSPADKAEVKLGDLVSAIDRQSTLSMSLTEVNILLSGSEARPVELKVLRGNDTREVAVARARLFSRAYTLASAAGRPDVLGIRDFAPSLTAELRRSVLPSLRARKRPFVLDLRNCPGGDIEEARLFLNLFLRAETVGSFDERDGLKRTVSCPAAADFGNLPVVVWAGPATIGPAELVAGVLQEVRKVRVLGLPTPGVVALTRRFPLTDESLVILVSGVFSLPSGRALWGQGLTPDVTVAANDQSDKAYFDKTLPLLPKL
jgi:carboxyl-terminal processing protease